MANCCFNLCSLSIYSYHPIYIQTLDKFKEKLVQVWMLDPYSEGIWWLCYAVGGILLAWFGSTCPLRGKSHCKSTQSCSESSPLSYDETFLSWCEWSLSGWQCPNLYVQKGSLNVLMSMKMMWVIVYTMALAVTRSQPKFNTYENFWTDVLHSALHHHQNNKWGSIVLKNGITDFYKK